MLTEMSTVGVEVSNSGEAVRFGVTAMTDERLVSCSNEGIDDSAAYEAGAAEHDHAHGGTRANGRFWRASADSMKGAITPPYSHDNRDTRRTIADCAISEKVQLLKPARDLSRCLAVGTTGRGVEEPPAVACNLVSRRAQRVQTGASAELDR